MPRQEHGIVTPTRLVTHDGQTNRPTDQQTEERTNDQQSDRPGHREFTLPIIARYKNTKKNPERAFEGVGGG